MPAASLRVRLLASLALAALSAALILPVSRLAWWLTNDAMEHLEIAWSLVNGKGFVDPVQWAYALPANVPLPAAAVRPPLVPLLLAIPLGLGASLSAVMLCHALLAALVAGAIVAVASRFLSLPAALAAALLIVLAPGWRHPALYPWTEITGVGCLLAVLASARGVLRSVPGALVCAAFTILAWLARPNLGALALAVLGAALLELGPRRALRSAPLWTYFAGFSALYAAFQAWSLSATGLAIYASYTGEMLSYEEIWSYGKRYVGTWRYLASHAPELRAVLAERVSQLAAHLFLRPLYHHVGWLVPFGAAWALLRRRDGAIEHRINALAALGLSLVVVLNYAGYEPRYCLFPALTGGLCGFGMLDAAARRATVRLGSRARVAGVAWPGLVPLAAVLVLFAVTTGPRTLEVTRTAWFHRHAGASLERDPRPFAVFCSAMDHDAVVASGRPWDIAFYCGNAALMLPLDLAEPGLRERFFAEKRPRYVEADASPAYRWLQGARGLRVVARSGEHALYEVLDPAPGAPPWRAPPPLVCAGRESDCVTRLAR